MRYYDPATGRYLTTDPIDLAGGTLNLTSYVNSDPVNYVDFTGTDRNAMNAFYGYQVSQREAMRRMVLAEYHDGFDWGSLGIILKDAITFKAYQKPAKKAADTLGIMMFGHDMEGNAYIATDVWRVQAILEFTPVGAAAGLEQQFYDKTTTGDYEGSMVLNVLGLLPGSGGGPGTLHMAAVTPANSLRPILNGTIDKINKGRETPIIQVFENKNLNRPKAAFGQESAMGESPFTLTDGATMATDATMRRILKINKPMSVPIDRTSPFSMTLIGSNPDETLLIIRGLVENNQGARLNIFDVESRALNNHLPHYLSLAPELAEKQISIYFYIDNFLNARSYITEYSQNFIYSNHIFDPNFFNRDFRISAAETIEQLLKNQGVYVATGGGDYHGVELVNIPNIERMRRSSTLNVFKRQ